MLPIFLTGADKRRDPKHAVSNAYNKVEFNLDTQRCILKRTCADNFLYI
jgi:hypothetical protein